MHPEFFFHMDWSGDGFARELASGITTTVSTGDREMASVAFAPPHKAYSEPGQGFAGAQE